MLKVKNIMTKELITVSADSTITDATKLLLEHNINGVPVLDSRGKLVGILCQSDLIVQQKKFPVPSLYTLLDSFIPLKTLKHLEEDIKKMAAAIVADAMTTDPVTINSEASIEEAATIMVEKNFHTLPVMDDEKLVGIVGKVDILKTLLPEEKPE